MKIWLKKVAFRLDSDHLLSIMSIYTVPNYYVSPAQRTNINLYCTCLPDNCKNKIVHPNRRVLPVKLKEKVSSRRRFWSSPTKGVTGSPTALGWKYVRTYVFSVHGCSVKKRNRRKHKGYVLSLPKSGRPPETSVTRISLTMLRV